jgi:exodeoxyribonuclease VII small subunit
MSKPKGPKSQESAELEQLSAELDQLSYEEAFAELESIVTALESDERPLDESLALFERGQALARHCTQVLDRAELRIQQLSGEQYLDFDSS